ncbi:AAA family ATPase [Lacrimispora xylanolytica]|uniref:Cytidylate kinase-like family protein n=1 Tax=Lacrimispora xylanolytica TaxID=29375 RepID=A0ABY7ADK5_9FIRM|nr:cytidylate kinase-like family protein [Lacrimispora xylanolytica]WAJ24323.1 cytidylate kinase-like family protein [Lacrimispora xylanolytica]
MKKFTITIAREFGSMGGPIARELSKELGVKFYDRDIVEEVAKKLKLPVSTISDEEEKSKHLLFSHMFPLGTDEDYMQDIIFDVQKDIILDLAKKESCILVGRCSNHILENQKNNINIFIYAPYQKRIENCVNSLGMTVSEAKRMIQSVDKARNTYHKKYAGYLPNNPEHTNLMIDSSLLGVTGTAQLIAGVVRQLFGEE